MHRNRPASAQASFRDADLSRATLRGASISGAVFTGADLVGVQLAGLDWRKARVDGPIAMLIVESLGAIVDPWAGSIGCAHSAPA